MLDAGLPLVAFLQIVRVYGQALEAIADAEVKLFHLYVHEPMIRDGAPVLDIAEELSDLASELLPLSGPIMEGLHQRLLQHFLEQDVVGHLESAGEDAALGRVRVAIAFADLAGYTRLTEELGEVEALEIVERFVARVTETLPESARVVKTIGDEVMVVGSDASSLVDWAVGFQSLVVERPLPRIGLHTGSVLYRDGDYYGRAVNLAARVSARATGGEVLITREVRDVAGRHLAFRAIGDVKLKGFDQATELFVARTAMTIAARVAATGLLSGPVTVLLSGGRDSVCLLDLAVQLAGPVTALHVNYGLRVEADADEAHCRALCERLGVALQVRRAGEPSGNVQAWAREVRYAAAAELDGGDRRRAHGDRSGRDRDLPADRVARAARAARDARARRAGRPAAARPHPRGTAAYCCERELPWVEDASNPASARGRIRALLALHPAAEANVARTLALLRDEAAVLESAVEAARGEELAALEPALARLVLQRLADEAGGPSIASHADAILALTAHGGTASLDLPGGLRATSSYGRVTIARPHDEPAPEPVTLSVPGRARFGDGELTAELAPDGLAVQARSRSAPGSPVTASGRPRERRPCRTCSPTARCRATSATGSPSCSTRAGSCGSRAWRAPSGTSLDRACA